MEINWDEFVKLTQCKLDKQKKTSHFISHHKESVRKWTVGDENTGNQARDEGKWIDKK